MIAPPKIDKNELINTIQELYGLNIKSVEFIPRGEASWCYKVETFSDKLFLKIYKDMEVSLNAFEFTSKLHSECGIWNIVYPLKTLLGEISFNFKDFNVVIFNYIEGKTEVEQSLNEQQLEQLGELLAKIHKSKELIGPYSKKEEFKTQFRDKFIKLYSGVDSFIGGNSYQRQAHQIYISYRKKFFDELEILESLGVKLRSSNIEYVNCHGEPSPGNIMVSEKGDIYLVDWDFPIYAPKENDLLFFTERMDYVLKGYKKVFPEAEINDEVVKYYGCLWSITEIEDFGTRLLVGELKEEEYKHNLKSLKHFLDYSGLGN